jgi:hypothetical protein
MYSWERCSHNEYTGSCRRAVAHSVDRECKVIPSYMVSRSISALHNARSTWNPDRLEVGGTVERRLARVTAKKSPQIARAKEQQAPRTAPSRCRVPPVIPQRAVVSRVLARLGLTGWIQAGDRRLWGLNLSLRLTSRMFYSSPTTFFRLQRPREDYAPDAMQCVVEQAKTFRLPKLQLTDGRIRTKLGTEINITRSQCCSRKPSRSP